VPELRFLTREHVAEELNISKAQLYALLRRGDLRHIKIGGRGLYRIGRDDLEDYIQRAYAETARWISEHLFSEDDAAELEKCTL
jgi:excisionase family DNA binding protein